MRRAQPDILDTNTVAALDKLKAAGFLAPADADALIASARLQHALTQVLRIALDETPDIEEATPGLKALLTRAAGMRAASPQVAERGWRILQTRDAREYFQSALLWAGPIRLFRREGQMHRAVAAARCR